MEAKSVEGMCGLVHYSAVSIHLPTHQSYLV